LQAHALASKGVVSGKDHHTWKGHDWDEKHHVGELENNVEVCVNTEA
jgi:hypothetical protein